MLTNRMASMFAVGLLLIVAGLGCIGLRSKADLHIFILAGQSNMVGGGNLSDPHTGPDSRIWTLDNTWIPAASPLPGSTGVGPGMAFAGQLLLYHPDWLIGLVPCARGGSSMAQWQRGSTFYQDCIKKLPATGGVMSGLLWWQGETDADNPLTAATWGDHFTAVVADFRADTGDPNLPVVYVQIGPDDHVPGFESWSVVQLQQALASVPGTIMVRSDDLSASEYRHPQFHFTTLGYEVMGRRLADAYERLTELFNLIYFPMVATP